MTSVVRVGTLLVLGLLGCRPATPPASPDATSWSFRDEATTPVSLATWRGSPLVVTMFYRGCSMRCPMTVAKLRSIEAELTKSGKNSQFVMVTLDPRNDTPERLAAFKKAQNLPATWHLLSGSDADTQAFARFLDVHAAYDVGHIDHDVKIVVFDRDGTPVRSYRGWSFDAREAASVL